MNKPSTWQYSSSGLTLVELIVSVGLFSVLILGIGSLFGEHAKMTGRASNEAEMVEQTQLFQFKAGNILSNATLIYSCGCPGNCGVSLDQTLIPVPLAGPGVRQVLLDFDSETSNDPTGLSYEGCVHGGGSSPSPFLIDNWTPRGCKKRFQLSFTGPSRETAGLLSIDEVDLDPSLSTVVRNWEKIPGVYEIVCGHPKNGVFLDTHSFFLSFKVKARSLNSPTRSESIGTIRSESWAPGFEGFELGTHREFSSLLEFRNISQRGVFFGNTLASSPCRADQSVDTGAGCCSGFKKSNGTCLSVENCKKQGESPSTSDPASGSLECCSHRMVEGLCT